jgi:hypothetical protein
MATTMVSRWTSGGIARELTTTKNAGESDKDFAARHARELAAMLDQFPRDP